MGEIARCSRFNTFQKVRRNNALRMSACLYAIGSFAFSGVVIPSPS